MDGLVATPDQETPVLPKETTRQHAVMSNSEITFEPHTHKYTSHIPPSNTRMHQHTAHTHARKHTAHTHTHTHTNYQILCDAEADLRLKLSFSRGTMRLKLSSHSISHNSICMVGCPT